MIMTIISFVLAMMALFWCIVACVVALRGQRKLKRLEQEFQRDMVAFRKQVNEQYLHDYKK